MGERRLNNMRLPLALVLALAVSHAGCGKSEHVASPFGGQSVNDVSVHLTDSNFRREVIDSDLAVLVDMWAPWCQPCIDMQPTIRQIARELHGQLKVGELNVADNAFITEKYGVTRYPTLIVFVDGEEVERFIGPPDKLALLHTLRKYPAGKRMR